MPNYQMMIGLLSDQIVAYRPALARALGGVNCGLFLQQIAYQAKDLPASEEGYSAWIWKTRSRMEHETALTRSEQETARRKLRAADVLEEDRRGVPARMHYRISWTRLFELLSGPVGGNPANWNEDPNTGRNPATKNAGSQPTSGLESNQPDGGNPANWLAGSQPTQRVRESQLEKSSETRAINQDQDFQDVLDLISKLSDERYSMFLGNDFESGTHHFHLATTGELFVYDGHDARSLGHTDHERAAS